MWSQVDFGGSFVVRWFCVPVAAFHQARQAHGPTPEDPGRVIWLLGLGWYMETVGHGPSGKKRHLYRATMKLQNNGHDMRTVHYCIEICIT